MDLTLFAATAANSARHFFDKLKRVSCAVQPTLFV